MLSSVRKMVTINNTWLRTHQQQQQQQQHSRVTR